MILAGNKCDMEDKRRVFPVEAQELAAQHNLRYFDVSAKENRNINECFEEIMNQVG